MLQTDVTADKIASPVKEQGCEEPAHSAVSVIKGVNAEEVVYKIGARL